MNRSLLLTFASVLVLASAVHAQKKPYDDLLVKYVDEKYEDCVSKAQRYT